MLRWVDSQVVNTLRQTTPVCRYRAGWGVAKKPRDHRNTADAAYCYMRRGLARPITSYGVLYGLVLHANDVVLRGPGPTVAWSAVVFCCIRPT